MKDTKKAALLDLLRRQWVTPLDCLRHCHLMTLSQRVSEFRAQGIDVADKWIERDGARFKAYRIGGAA